MITLLAGIQLTPDVLRTLSTVRDAVGNARSQQQANGLMTWVRDYEPQLRSLIPMEEIERLMLTRRYWAVVADPRNVEVLTMASAELDDAKARWDFEIAELDAWTKRWSVGDLFVAADTNVYLHHTQAFEEIDWRTTTHRLPFDNIRFVIPMIVVDELDRLKDTGQGHVRTRARTTLRTIAGMFDAADGMQHHGLENSTADAGWTVANIVPDPTGRYVRYPRADDEIVRRLTSLRDTTCKNVILVTYDVGMSLRARVAGLTPLLLERPPDSGDKPKL